MQHPIIHFWGLLSEVGRGAACTERVFTCWSADYFYVFGRSVGLFCRGDGERENGLTIKICAA